MAGLQGVGKTTACGKLALYLRKQKKKVLMVATDVYRPAAIEQLVKLGERIKVPVFEQGTDAKPEAIAAAGIKHVGVPLRTTWPAALHMHRLRLALSVHVWLHKPSKAAGLAACVCSLHGKWIMQCC